MIPAEKHRETARNLMDAACLPEHLVKNGTDKCLRIDIANALDVSFREGMKRAAEIALREGDRLAPAVGYVISQAILSDAGEDAS